MGKKKNGIVKSITNFVEGIVKTDYKVIEIAGNQTITHHLHGTVKDVKRDTFRILKDAEYVDLFKDGVVCRKGRKR